MWQRERGSVRFADRRKHRQRGGADKRSGKERLMERYSWWQRNAFEAVKRGRASKRKMEGV